MSLYVQAIHGPGASNTIGGDDSGGAALAAADEDSRLRFWNPNTGNLMALNNAVGIPRPGALNLTATTPLINFCKGLADSNPNTIYVIVPTAVGGRALNGGTFDPDGAGPAWTIGGSPADTLPAGALYLAYTNGTIPNSVNAAIAASFPDRIVLPPKFYGHIPNENDSASPAFTPLSVLIDKGTRAIAGLRTAVGAANAEWVVAACPPEWTNSGAGVREKIEGANVLLAQLIPRMAFVRGQENNPHPTEPIHNTNAGYRLLGTRAAPALAVATARSAAPRSWFDWIDSLTNTPARFFGLYRGRSAYGTGNCIRVTNGTTTIDVPFLSSGIPDIAAIETLAGSGDAWITGFYDQMTGTMSMVPEGTGRANLVKTGEILWQGRRLAWGNDETAIRMFDNSFALTAAGALLAVGRMNNAGNPVMAAGPPNTLGIFGVTGATAYARGSGLMFFTNPAQEREPSFVSALPGSPGGYNTFANYVDATGMRADGVAVTEGASTTQTYGTAGILSWGGRATATNRDSVGSHTALAAWATAPTGADYTRVQAWCAAIGATDDLV